MREITKHSQDIKTSMPADTQPVIASPVITQPSPVQSVSSDVVSVSDSVTVSQCHSVIVSQCHSVTVSQCHCDITTISTV